MGKRSVFIDEMGAPKTDLRSRPLCPCCGVKVTRKNFAMSSTSFDNGWSEVKYYCSDCFLKPEVVHGEV